MNLTEKPTTQSPLQWMRWHAQQADDALTKMHESDGPVHVSLSNAICAEAQVHATLAVAWATIVAARQP